MTTTSSAPVKYLPGRLLLALVMLGLGVAFPIWCAVTLAQDGPNPFLVLFIAFSALAFSALFIRNARYQAAVHEIDRFFDVLVIGYFSYQALFVAVNFPNVLWLTTFLFTFILTLVRDVPRSRS